MNFPSDIPKLPKWIFLLSDAVLLAAAWIVKKGADHPSAGAPLIAIVVLVVVAVAVGVYPFITDDARKYDQAVDDRQKALQTMAATVATAAEQVSIAASGLQAISAAAQENFARSEEAAVQISDKLAAFEGQVAAFERRLAGTRPANTESDIRLDAAVRRVARAAAAIELTVTKVVETARAAPPATIPEPPPVLAGHMVEIRPAFPAADDSAAPIPPSDLSAPVDLAPPAAVERELVAPAEQLAEPAPPPRRRAARKAAPSASAETPAPAEIPAPAETPAEPVPPPPEEPAAPAAPEELEPAAVAAEMPEPAVSADGATRLVVTAYIGIGNRLFIRGDGPGLSWDKGVPLTFVSIGKWRWETNDAAGPVRFRLFKNDSVECTALGECTVEPGAQQEFTASF